VYAHQSWLVLQVNPPEGMRSSGVWTGTCFNCKRRTLWINVTNDFENEDPDGILLWPRESTSAPPPHPDIPGDVRADYEEARGIVDRSPRGACALLRLAVQKLMVDLGEDGKNINSDIKSLVGKGLAVEVQQALDAVRVVGNNAVHPGELDVKDDRDTAAALFGVLNFIIEQRISQPKKLAKLYGSLPAASLAAIQARDAGSGDGTTAT
jgi:hypothetical protein